MKILFLHSGDRVPSSRFRILPFARRLRAAGHRCTLAASFPQKYDYLPWLGFRPSQYLKRLVRWWHLLQARVGQYDALVIDRELFDDPTVAMEDRFRRTAKRLILELDDAVFLRYPDKIAHLCRIADHVIVGNTSLEEYARQFNDQLTIIPTCVELDDYPPKNFSAGRAMAPVVGWIGSQGSLPYLHVVAPALRRLARRREFELRVVSSGIEALAQVDLSGISVCGIPWHGVREVEEIRQFDLGLMPLRSDEPWACYKCNTKLIQYMAVGIPAVASAVGMNHEIVQHGVNGLLAASDEEWETALEMLIVDTDLRRRLGEAARSTIEQRYSVGACFSRYLAAVEPRCPAPS